MKPLLLGLAGCGLWGQLILRELRLLGVEVVVADPAPERRQAALELGARAVVDLPAALPDVDALVVATPAATHATIVRSLWDRQRPMLVEKPLSTDVATAAEIVRLGANRVFVGHVWRYHPGIELLGSLARSGELGPVHGLRSLRANWTSPRTDVDSVWNLAPHDLTLALEILGHIPEARAANAELSEGRAVGLTALLGGTPWLEFTVSNRYHDKRREVRLHCRDGIGVLTDPDQGFVEIVRGNAQSKRPEIERRPYVGESALRRQLAAFLAFVAGGNPPKSDAAEGLAVIRTIATLRQLAHLPEQP